MSQWASLTEPGRFSPLGALSELGVPGAVRRVIEGAQAQATAPGRVLVAAWPRTWAKVVHLIGLPLLDATRPWQLRYAVGDGLLGICQIAYRFDTINRALGELKRLQVGDALRHSLCQTWVRTLVETDEPLHIYVDAHLKPHWTHQFMPCGHLPLLDRVMPCTRQVIVTNPQGYVWEVIDRVGDAALGQELPAVERELEWLAHHPVTLTVVDREANSLELAQIYAKSEHFALLTLLDDPVSVDLQVGTPAFADVFRLTGRWQPLATQPGWSLAPATWSPARGASDDPRVFWLVQDEAHRTLRAVYALSQSLGECAPDLDPLLRGHGARQAYQARWTAMDAARVIREMVAGDNLNANYGYDCHEVPNRLRQHQAQAAQAQLTATENQLMTNHHQLETFRAQHAECEQTLAEQLADLATLRREHEAEGKARHLAGLSTRRVEQQLAHLDRQAQTLTTRHARRTTRFEAQTRDLTQRQAALDTKRAERQATLAAIDLTQPMFERDLEKDQIMADFQAALLNAHRWCCDHYFTGEWRHMELETAITRVYRQRGRVVYSAQRVDVTLVAFDYSAEHELAQAACTRFNAAQVHDAAGRLIVMAIAPFHHCVKQL